MYWTLFGTQTKTPLYLNATLKKDLKASGKKNLLQIVQRNSAGFQKSRADTQKEYTQHTPYKPHT